MFRSGRGKWGIFIIAVFSFAAGFLQKSSFAVEDYSVPGVLLFEDVLINTPPLDLISPSYDNTRLPLITEFNPNAEYLYFDNLKLGNTFYKLSQIQENFWVNSHSPVPSGLQIRRQAEEAGGAYNAVAGDEYRVLWKHSISRAMVSDYYFERRQWIKKYEEDFVRPEFYKNGILVRNENRIFFIDSLTGNDIWSFTNDKERNELYQTSRPPHVNSSGTEFTVHNGRVISELSGKLISLDVSQSAGPRLVWERDLGEFSLCAEPVVNNNAVLVFLVNSRQEISAAGFDVDTGEMKWSTYVGMSTFLSPGSDISVSKGDVVYAGLNRGLLVAINSADGTLYWIRAYQEKKYNILKYWVIKNGRKKKISFDTGFLSMDLKGVLHYKPRESDYLYLIDSETGKLKKEVNIEDMDSMILYSNDNVAFFLKNSKNVGGMLEVRRLDLESDKQTVISEINAGKVRGVLSVNAQLIFMVGSGIYFLDINGEVVRYADCYSGSAAWLANYSDGRLLLVDRLSISLLPAGHSVRRSAGQSKEIDGTAVSKEVNVPGEKRLFVKASKSFIAGQSTEKGSYLVNGGNLKVIPIEVISGRKDLDFLLLATFNQLLCVKDSKQVLWGRRFYLDDEVNFIEPEAYLVDNVLIFKDVLNVLAVNVKDGSYIWSVSRSSFPRVTLAANIQTRFINTKEMLVAFDGRLLVLDVRSGTVLKTCATRLQDADQLAVDGNNYYVFSKGDKVIKKFNRELREVNSFIVPGIENIKQANGLFCVGDKVLLHTDAKWMIFDERNGVLIASRDISTARVELYEGDVLVISPYKKIVRYRITMSGVLPVWERELDASDQLILWRSDDDRDHSMEYFIVNDAVLMLYKKDNAYFMSKVSLKTGEIVWDVKISDLGGLVYALSEPSLSKGNIYFFLSTTCHQFLHDVDCNPELAVNAGCNLSTVRSEFAGLNLLTGDIVYKEELRALNSSAPKTYKFAQTKDYFYFVLGNVELNAKAKALNEK